MSTANSARNRKSASPEKKQFILLPPNHPYAEQVNTAVPTEPEIYGSNPNAQYAVGCSMGNRAASLYSSAGGPLLSEDGWLQSIVLNAAESLPEHVARGFIVGFLAAIERLIPVDPRCIKAQVRGIRGFSESVYLKSRVELLECSLRGNEVCKKALKDFDDVLNKTAVGKVAKAEVDHG